MLFTQTNALILVTAHGVGAFGQKPILAKNARGERTPGPR